MKAVNAIKFALIEMILNLTKGKITMNTIKKFLMTAVSALLLVTTSAFGGECMRVNAVANETAYLEAPDCNGFDFCISYDLKGKPKGELWLYSNYGETHQLPDPLGTGLPFHVSHAEYRLDTKDGDIYMSTNAIYDMMTTVFAEVSIVTGGTGKYEGATGNVVGYVNSRKPSDWYFSGPIYFIGNICTS